MTTVLVGTLAVTMLTAALLLMLPAVSRATLPLGVLVPSSRAADPVVTTAIRRYRIGIAISFVVALVAAALVASLGPAAAPLTAVFLLLGGSVVAYLVPRRGIQRATREDDWLVDVPVRISGSVTPDAEARPSLAAGWFAASLAVLLAATATGIVLYADLPAMIPVHWDSSGQPDSFAEKTLLSVFGPILIAVGTLALMVGVSMAVRGVAWHRGSGDEPAVADRIAALQAKLTQSLLGWMAFAVSTGIAALSVIGWLHAGSPEPSPWIAVVAIGLIVVLFAMIAVYAVRLVSGTRAIRSAARDTATAAAGAGRDVVDPRDEDRHWKGGLVYVNPGDPALFVPKRFGVGVTINIGHPGGILIGVVTLLVVAAALTLPVLLR